MPIGSGDRADSVLRMLREQYVDGAVLAPGHRVPAAELARLAAHGQRLVVFEDTAAPDGFDVVRQYQASACYQAVGHLIRAGHRRIAYFGHGDPSGPPDDCTKYGSYRGALVDHGIPIDDSLIVTAADHRTAAHLATMDLLRRPDRPTALFSASDRGGIAAIGAARQLGVSVPDDLAVVGVGNTDEGEVIEPPLTSVGIPSFDFSVVVERLFERVTSRVPLPGIELFEPWELIIRRSA